MEQETLYPSTRKSQHSFSHGMAFHLNKASAKSTKPKVNPSCCKTYAEIWAEEQCCDSSSWQSQGYHPLCCDKHASKQLNNLPSWTHLHHAKEHVSYILSI
jgi:hypothetical protein